MTPDFDIIAEGNQVTEALKKSLISLRITDESGTTSDEAEIHIDYGSNALELKGELKVFLGYKETGLLPVGVYTASEISIQSPPQTLRVRCHAANFKSSLKEKTSREWKDITLGDLVREIAQKHGHNSKVAEKFENVPVSYKNQTNESDLNFLKGLGREHDALVKPVGGYIIFIPRGEGKSATGKVLGTTVLTPKDVINWKVNFNVRNKYGSVIAKWYSYEKGKTIEEKVGNEGSSYLIQDLYPTAESAVSAATAKLKQLKRSTSNLNVTVPGNPTLFAEAKISLSGFFQEIEGEWVVNRAEHILDSKGYQTIIEAVQD
ncbi:phage late control D family protein [Wolbachia endosymbiont of Folsomia candida]|uniref:phage late control D family protein n=1 Tax=Wolbachia endosymbiont of Folsomia candida TaxID=169402 RepID=UPI000A437746|nr:contractile injection system protein, VgrG/Pvc8 family [Wolbachia endosymbiont of Folsomia candida]APR98591.1 phage tail protein [Wolbachia endosymbiont of Folsomia candida]